MWSSTSPRTNLIAKRRKSEHDSHMYFIIITLPFDCIIIIRGFYFKIYCFTMSSIKQKDIKRGKTQKKIVSYEKHNRSYASRQHTEH